MDDVRNPFAMEMNGWRTLARWINHEGAARDIFTDN